MTVIAGHDPLDPTSADEPVPDYEAALDGDIAGLRIGLPTTYFDDGADASVLAAVEAAVAVLVARGATVVRLPLPVMDAVAAYGSIISRVEGGAIHAQWMRERPGDYSVHLSARLYGGNAIPGTYYVEALSRRGPVLRAFAKEVFWPGGRADHAHHQDLPAHAGGDGYRSRAAPATEHTFMAVSANTRPFNYLGLPAISVNCGFDPNGCPIGLQIAGRRSPRRGC